jgi:hypothetical protein
MNTSAPRRTSVSPPVAWPVFVCSASQRFSPVRSLPGCSAPRLSQTTSRSPGQPASSSVDPGEPAEQRGLALHHRQRRERSLVTQPEQRRPVTDDRHRVALDRLPARLARVVRDPLGQLRHTRRVMPGQVTGVIEPHPRGDFDLAVTLAVVHLPGLPGSCAASHR